MEWVWSCPVKASKGCERDPLCVPVLKGTGACVLSGVPVW